MKIPRKLPSFPDPYTLPLTLICCCAILVTVLVILGLIISER